MGLIKIGSTTQTSQPSTRSAKYVLNGLHGKHAIITISPQTYIGKIWDSGKPKKTSTTHHNIYFVYDGKAHFFVQFTWLPTIEVIGDINKDGWEDFSLDGIKYISITDRKKKFDYMSATSYYWKGTPYFQKYPIGNVD